MTEITSGNIQVGQHYIAANLIDYTGYITYNGVQYIHGASFFGQFANDTFTTSTGNMKVYLFDDVVLTTDTTLGIIDDEMGAYPEEVSIKTTGISKNYSDSENIVYPEKIKIQNITLSKSNVNNSKILYLK